MEIDHDDDGSQRREKNPLASQMTSDATVSVRQVRFIARRILGCGFITSS
jgi:hypothetical protein